MANNFSLVGGEIQVNLTPNQNGSQSEPDIASLTDGRFFVAFRDVDPASNIVGQFVNGDGTLAGSNIDIELDAFDQIQPAVAQRLGDGAVVVWTDTNAAFSEVQYAIVSSAGGVGLEQTIL